MGFRAVPVEVGEHRIRSPCFSLSFGDPGVHALGQVGDDALFPFGEIFQLERVCDEVVEFDFGFEVEIGL